MTMSLPQETLLAIIAVQQEIVEVRPKLDEVMNVVVGAAAKLTSAEAGVVEIQEQEEMVYRAVAGTAARHIGLRLLVGKSLSGLCVRLNEPLRCDDCETDERVDREACRKVNARSMLVTPLRFHGQALGVLKVYSGRVRAFDESNAETLRLLVGIISASMHRAQEHEHLSQRALRDSLTELPNRSRLESAIDEEIAGNQAFALGFLDLRGFKSINDRYGHVRADQILQIIARRIATSVRDCDVATRFGGDEFVVLLKGISTRGAAAETMKRIIARISEPIAEGDAHVCVSADMGIALFPNDGLCAQSLLEVADSRMYDDKRRGRGPIAID